MAEGHVTAANYMQKFFDILITKIIRNKRYAIYFVVLLLFNLMSNMFIVSIC
jgi:hypothetical protein